MLYAKMQIKYTNILQRYIIKYKIYVYICMYIYIYIYIYIKDMK